MNQPLEQRQFLICITEEDCDDLQVWKIYQQLPDEKAEKEAYVRVIDDSGEDYLYPDSCFIPVNFPETITQQLIAATPSVA